MDSIAPYISEERDALYLREVSKTKEKFVVNLLTKSGFPLTLEQAADMAEVSVEFVRKMKQKLSAGK